MNKRQEEIEYIKEDIEQRKKDIKSLRLILSKLEKRMTTKKVKEPTKEDYRKAYNIFMDFWEYIDEYQQPEIDKKLKRLGL